MFILKKILRFIIFSFLLVSTGYYVLGKYVLKTDSQFIILVDIVINFTGKCLNFLAQHIFAVLIVVALAVILFLIYKMIVNKNSGDKE
jgi:hypothetical protein